MFAYDSRNDCFAMLKNPFTPTEIAASPDLFFGRRDELAAADMGIKKGSLLIQGGMGIGKSSLLAQVRLRAEGFCSDNAGNSICVVGQKDIKNVEDLARMLLDGLVEIDESSSSFKLKLGPVAEYESNEVVKNFGEGRHCATLLKILNKKFIGPLAESDKLLIIAIDEADKCPVPIARLIRAVSTHLQQEHIASVRFIIAGVNPYFKVMLDEDTGLQRFFYKKIALQPMPIEEAKELFEAKLENVRESAEEQGIDLVINPDVVWLSVRLSGGHPHVLQLLGSHMIDRENLSSDGVIDKNDMLEALRTICYDDRVYVYDQLLHSIRMEGYEEILHRLLSMADASFPTRIPRESAASLEARALDWLIDHNILLVANESEYGFVDEFLRVRILLDRAGENPRDMASRIISFSPVPYHRTTRDDTKTDVDYYEDVVRDFAKKFRDIEAKDPFES